jgi:hypothetical protein
VDYLGIAARMPATMVGVCNIVIDRYAVMAFRPVENNEVDRSGQM